MKNETMMMQEGNPAKKEETTTPVIFKCPNCMMGATCSDCNMYRKSDGRCLQWGGYCDPSRWACDWYYKN